MTIPTPLSEARKLPAGVRDALLILLADERDGIGETWSAASNRADPGPDGSYRRVSGRAATALERRRLAVAHPSRRLGRLVVLTDKGRKMASALYAAGRPASSAVS